eukprot:scaffold9485_cov248-Ochromonas_danica.AAC.4
MALFFPSEFFSWRAFSGVVPVSCFIKQDVVQMEMIPQMAQQRKSWGVNEAYVILLASITNGDEDDG